MTLLELNRLSKHYDAEPVLQDLALKINRGEKVGLIGANGCGKSTLLKLVAGLEHPTSGTIARPKGTTVGYLAQTLECAENRTLVEEVTQAFAAINQMGDRLQALEEAMADPAAEARLEDLLKRYSELSARFEQLGGYTLEHRIDAVLLGLGLETKRHRPLTALSGGEKNIVALAKVLLLEPDILLLDEPANHLDFDGLEWLETFLRNYDKTFILVSHNRYLLDRTVERIVELEDRQVTSYPGNYSLYRAEKMRATLRQKAAYDDQQKEIGRLQQMIKRYEHWGRLSDNPAHARRARNTARIIERMDKVDRPQMERRHIAPAFAEGQRSGHIALELKSYNRRFGQQLLFDNAQLLVASGERVGLLGPNGSGKSTLLKDIVAQAAWDHPALRIGPKIRLGYYDQQHQTLDPQRSIAETVQHYAGLARQEAFVLLHRFLFAWEEMDKKVEVLSGGEKARVQLARLTASDANFLLLDEPTNHLDLSSREQVEEALEEYTGTLLVVSHDRYFLDRVVDRIVEIDGGDFKSYPGDFSYYWRQKRARPQQSRPGKKQPRRQAQGRQPEKNTSAAVETKIETLEREKQQLEKQVAAAYDKRDFKRGEKLSQRMELMEKEIERLYKEWTG